jgi:hemolysin activation/secretion protein
MAVSRAKAHLAGIAFLVAGAWPLAPVAAQAQAQAQVTPPNRTELVPPDLRRDERAPSLTVEGDLARPPCALDRPEFADIRFTVKGAQFAGLEKVPGFSLRGAWQDFANREMPVSVVCDIRAEANAILRRAGYLAAVEIPEQSLADGIVDFTVIFGRLTSIRVRGEAGPSEKLVEAYLQKLTDQPVFNANEAERYLLLADDLPGLAVRLSLQPAAGGAPGDLAGEIAVLRERGAINVSFQNLGSREIGRFGGLVRGEIYDLTGLGDRTFVTLFSTLDVDEQQTVQVGHDFRVGSEGLRLGGQLTWSTVEPDIGQPAFALESETVFASLFASYPVARSRRHSLFADVGLDLVDQDVTINALPLSRDRVRVAFLRFNGEAMDEGAIRREGGYSTFEPRFRARYGFELRHGLDILSASPDCRANLLACVSGGAVPPSRIESDPTALVVRIDGGLEFRPDPLLTFALNTNAQLSSDPLPAFEEIAGGNFSIGRGFDPGAVLGDSGIAGAFEVRYGSLAPKSIDGFALQPYVFTDVAIVWNEDPSLEPLNPNRLWSAGGGLRAAWGSRMQGDFVIAVPLEKPDLAPELGAVRFLFTLTARLFPWRY